MPRSDTDVRLCRCGQKGGACLIGFAFTLQNSKAGVSRRSICLPFVGGPIIEQHERSLFGVGDNPVGADRSQLHLYRFGPSATHLAPPSANQQARRRMVPLARNLVEPEDALAALVTGGTAEAGCKRLDVGSLAETTGKIVAADVPEASAYTPGEKLEPLRQAVEGLPPEFGAIELDVAGFGGHKIYSAAMLHKYLLTCRVL